MKRKAKVSLAGIILMSLLTACSFAPSLSNPTAMKEILNTSTPFSLSVTPIITTRLQNSVTPTGTKTPTVQPTKSVTPTMTVAATETPTGESQSTVTNLPGCESTKLPKPQINKPDTASDNTYIKGSFVLCIDLATFTFDLDKGTYEEKDTLPIFLWESENYRSETDIGLIVGPLSPITGTRDVSIRGINGARVIDMETDNLTVSLCMQRISSARPSPFFINTGATGCVVTDKGRIAIIKIESIDVNGLGSVEISFTTYNLFMPKQ